MGEPKKVAEARRVLEALGLPPAQQNEISAYTLLALGNLGRATPWAAAKRRSIGVHDIKEWVRETYAKLYAENTRETFRRRVLHQLEQARVVDRNPDEPSLPTNSPRTHYALTEAALSVVRAFGTKAFEKEATDFRKKQGALLEVYRASRQEQVVTAELPSGATLTLSPGRHNEVQRAVLADFRRFFAPDSEVLYVSDTAKKLLFVETEKLERLSIPVSDHDKLPDIVLFAPSRSWLILVEAVTAHGPVSPKRRVELEKVFAACPLTRVYVSAFPDLAEFKRHVADIAWETEVWVAEIPDHLIHYNGEKFLGPSKA